MVTGICRFFWQTMARFFCPMMQPSCFEMCLTAPETIHIMVDKTFVDDRLDNYWLLPEQLQFSPVFTFVSSQFLIKQKKFC